MEPDIHKVVYVDTPTLVVCCITIIGLGISLVLCWCFCLVPQRPPAHQAIRVTLRDSPSPDHTLMHRRFQVGNVPDYDQIYRYYTIMNEESRNRPPSYNSTVF